MDTPSLSDIMDAISAIGAKLDSQRVLLEEIEYRVSVLEADYTLMAQSLQNHGRHIGTLIAQPSAR